MQKPLSSSYRILLSAKFKIFYATVRSVMSCGAQVWDSEYHNRVQKQQRFFIKKVFSLPSNTLSYVLYLEAELEELNIYTAILNLNYLQTIFKLPPDRTGSHVFYYMRLLTKNCTGLKIGVLFLKNTDSGVMQEAITGKKTLLIVMYEG